MEIRTRKKVPETSSDRILENACRYEDFEHPSQQVSDADCAMVIVTASLAFLLMAKRAGPADGSLPKNRAIRNQPYVRQATLGNRAVNPFFVVFRKNLVGTPTIAWTTGGAARLQG